jgi:hypothetical protein
MKTSRIHPLTGRIKNETSFIKSTAVMIVKYFLLVCVGLSITLLTSCMFPGPGHGRPPKPPMERHGNNSHQGQGEHHDKDDHRAN